MARKQLPAATTDTAIAHPTSTAALNRDYMMARVGAALASFRAAIEACDSVLAFYVNPDEDKRGKQRLEEIEDALEAAGAGTRALEDALAKYERSGDAGFSLAEPWEEKD